MKKLFKPIISIILSLCTIVSLNIIPTQAATALEFGNTLETATPIEINTTYKAHVNATGWITFTTPSVNGYYTIKTITNSADEDFTGSIYDTNMNEQGNEFRMSITSGSTTSETYDLAASTTYYLKMDDCRANYEKWTGKDCNINFSFLINFKKDKEGNDISSATKIALKKAKTATMDSDKDVDWFKFKTNSTGTYKFVVQNKKSSSVQAGASLKFIIYTKDLEPVRLSSSKNKYVTYDSINLYPGDHSTVTMKLKKNKTYYIEVCGNTSWDHVNNSKYTLKVTK